MPLLGRAETAGAVVSSVVHKVRVSVYSPTGSDQFVTVTRDRAFGQVSLVGNVGHSRASILRYCEIGDIIALGLGFAMIAVTLMAVQGNLVYAVATSLGN